MISNRVCAMQLLFLERKMNKKIWRCSILWALNRRADFYLFVHRDIITIIEAKKISNSLHHISWQSERSKWFLSHYLFMCFFIFILVFSFTFSIPFIIFCFLLFYCCVVRIAYYSIVTSLIKSPLDGIWIRCFFER